MQAPKRALDRKDPAATNHRPESCSLRVRISQSDRLIVQLVDTGSTPFVILIRQQRSIAWKRAGASFLIMTRPPLRSLTGLG
jgi:hypothetical protein